MRKDGRVIRKGCFREVVVVLDLRVEMGYREGYVESRQRDGRVLWVDLRYEENGIPRRRALQRMGTDGCRIKLGVADRWEIRNEQGIVRVDTTQGRLQRSECRQKRVGGNRRRRVV